MGGFLTLLRAPGLDADRSCTGVSLADYQSRQGDIASRRSRLQIFCSPIHSLCPVSPLSAICQNFSHALSHLEPVALSVLVLLLDY